MNIVNDDQLTSAASEGTTEATEQTPATPEPTNEASAVTEPVVEAVAPAAEEVAPEPAAVVEAPAPVAEAPAPEPVKAPAPKAPAQSDEDLFAAALAELSSDNSGEPTRRLNKGDRIEATVIQVEKDRVFVDLGTKSEGVVPLNELSEQNLDTAIGAVNVGDKINVVVIQPEGRGDGNPVVSKKKADFEETWYKVVDAFNAGVPVTATVVDRVKGGLVVDVGVRGFVPATHVGSGKLRNLDKFVGETLELKIIEIDKERKKVVLSNREAEESKREEVKAQLFGNANPGDVIEGTVRRLTDYGAFVDLGGIDGLLHISEMSWMRINHPKEVLKEGQSIKVMVLRLDKDTGKISLGHRQVLPDPWKLIQENYKIGQKVTCTVGRLVTSGVFIRLPEQAEAFLPVSEISTRRINKPADVLEEGQEIEVQVIDLRPDERRMVLSMRAAGTAIEPPADYVADAAPAYDSDSRGGGRSGGSRMPGGRKGGSGRKGHDGGDFGSTTRTPTGGATIGERLGMLKGLLNRTEPEEEEK